ncbi:alpha/beta hydrolase [Erythrobacter sp. LQ02-29]|uniref:alpha/beta hydrolase n=1 Tax=Erythrobacter sp. LQ02-29 TaxID=2920384 RepID=UPI001F4EB86F|nr:alpha/beta hydrolase [Erythrobacter sp. LQ02-29]MCP9221211.1 alpha/beta hydrolase [Erythrobacter sp. LQ02-29]
MLATSVALAAFGGGAASAAAASPGGATATLDLAGVSDTIALWPQGAPGDLDPNRVEQMVERSTDTGIRDRAMSGISNPRMLVVRARQPNGGALVVIPGGGYRHIVVDKEGLETARWAAENGLTAFVLFHRLPGEGWADRANVPSRDAQRAVRLARDQAGRYRFDPARIAMIGFSAGGHVAAEASVNAAGAAAPVDAADREDCTPACTALLYPVISMREPLAHAGSRRLLLGERPTAAAENAHSPDRNVSGNAPPFFLAHAEDDGAVSVQNTLAMRDALKAKGIAVDTHLFAEGGHGFGMRRIDRGALSLWPQMFLAWLKEHGIA